MHEDEKKARRVASMVYNLKVLGTGGLLLKEIGRAHV